MCAPAGARATVTSNLKLAFNFEPLAFFTNAFFMIARFLVIGDIMVALNFPLDIDSGV